MNHIFIFKIVYLIVVFLANSFSIVSAIKFWRYFDAKNKIMKILLIAISLICSFFALDKIDYLLKKF